MARAAPLALLAIVAAIVVASAQQAPADPITKALKDNGFNAFLKLMPVAGLTPQQMLAGKTQFTLLPPTDKALEVFLKRMNLTMADMMGRPSLAAAVVGYHVLPRVRGRASDVRNHTKAAPLEARTADGAYSLRFYWDARDNQVVVQDVHGGTAEVIKQAIDAGPLVIIHGLDAVLRNGDVFYTLPEFLAAHPDFDLMEKAVRAAGIDKEVDAMRLKSNTLTVFAPTDDALTAATALTSKLSGAQMKELLRYHMLPGAFPIPSGFKSGSLYDTLAAGHKLKVNYIPVPAKDAQGKAQQAGLDVEVLSDGTAAGLAKGLNPQVVLANVFASRVIIHGIDGVLVPKGLSDARRSAGRRLLAFGRSLLQYRRSASRTGVAVNSVAMTSTQSAIRDAVEGRTDAGYAAYTGLGNAQAASVSCWNCIIYDDFGRRRTA